MEVPRKPDALLDEQVQEFVRRDGVDVFPGITDGRHVFVAAALAVVFAVAFVRGVALDDVASFI